MIDRLEFDNLSKKYKLEVYKFRKGEEYGVYVSEEYLIQLENEMQDAINECHSEAVKIDKGENA